MTGLTLGAEVDPTTHERTGTPTILPADELTTHAVIVGRTGSGKTGLGVVLIEECLAAGVPALLIDPKGDLANLALTFPNLSPEEFAPWVSTSEATKAGVSTAEFAAAEARRWSAGLSGWGLDADRVRALHDAAGVTIYTPGAPHGRRLNIVGTLEAPADTSDPQALGEEVDAYVSSILNLVGIDADPLSSREHILLTSIIGQAWEQGRELDLAGLVAAVQQPPFRKVGVLQLDAYYPESERASLALKLNGLLAAPAFSAWLGGERIDIDAMLRTPDGRPRCAIISTAHLSDEQRQSATSVILAKLISWMRRQEGTSDLRALLYMDEVAGYLPPVGNPPTKAPLMLLLKQARAFGLGVVLSTQNPVDVDYKALSNAGTWLVGRLQTEQDRARLLDGLASAAGTVDTSALSDTIAGLAAREFVGRRASRDDVSVFTTRWALSYLRGPLTRAEIEALTQRPQPADSMEPAPAAPPSGGAEHPDETPVAPAVAARIPVHYLDPAASWAPAVGAVPGTRLVAAAIARVQMRFDEAKADLVHDEEYEAVLCPLSEQSVAGDFVAVDYDDRDLLDTPPEGATYRLVSADIATSTWWTRLKRDLADYLYRSRTIEIPANTALKLYGRVGEPPERFAERCRAAAQDAADDQIAALQSRYAKKSAALDRRIDAAQQALDRHRSARTSTLAADVIGGLFGRRGPTLRSVARRATTATQRIDAAEDKLVDLERALADLQAELSDEIAAVNERWAGVAADVGSVEVPLEKSDVKVTAIGLVWIPVGT